MICVPWGKICWTRNLLLPPLGSIAGGEKGVASSSVVLRDLHGPTMVVVVFEPFAG